MAAVAKSYRSSRRTVVRRVGRSYILLASIPREFTFTVGIRTGPVGVAFGGLQTVGHRNWKKGSLTSIARVVGRIRALVERAVEGC
jgi:hypothetical protein